MNQQQYSKLRGRIREVFGTQEAFAKALNIHSTSLSARLNDKAQWRREEIVLSCELLSIPIDDVSSYFF